MFCTEIPHFIYVIYHHFDSDSSNKSYCNFTNHHYKLLLKVNRQNINFCNRLTFGFRRSVPNSLFRKDDELIFTSSLGE